MRAWVVIVHMADKLLKQKQIRSVSVIWSVSQGPEVGYAAACKSIQNIYATCQSSYRDILDQGSLCKSVRSQSVTGSCMFAAA
jgi:hypothetical protein